MHNLQDIRATVSAELTHWHARHKGEPFGECYLWYAPTTAERDGGILAAADQPAPEYLLVTHENLVYYSPASAVQRLTALNILSRLPVLALSAY